MSNTSKHYCNALTNIMLMVQEDKLDLDTIFETLRKDAEEFQKRMSIGKRNEGGDNDVQLKEVFSGSRD